MTFSRPPGDAMHQGGLRAKKRGMGIDRDAALREIDASLVAYRELRAKCRHEDGSDQKGGPLEFVASRLMTTLERFAPPGSFHAKQAKSYADGHWNAPHVLFKYLPGVLQALRDDIANNRTASIIELVHADVFSDFLDMAKHLLDQGFKDAAAVIAGSSLEAHLRALCTKHGIDTNDKDAKPKKASSLNAELDKAHAYRSSGDPKSVTAWLDTRNDAAHGDYDKYLPQQVNLMIAGVRDFMLRYPA
jgi:hypothetical protein